MTDKCPVFGEFYKDDSGRLYQVRGMAIDSRTRRDIVIYQALFGAYETFAAEREDFCTSMTQGSVVVSAVSVRSQVSETVTASQNASGLNSSIADVREISGGSPSVREEKISELMMSFFDENDFEKKDEILSAIKTHPQLNDSIIDNLAASIDVVIDSGDIDQRFRELRTCVRTRARFESTRLR